MPIDASVMPTWQAAMYSSIRSICFSASAAPFAPSFASAWIRSSRERTIEYSAGDEERVHEDERRYAQQEDG